MEIGTRDKLWRWVLRLAVAMAVLVGGYEAVRDEVASRPLEAGTTAPPLTGVGHRGAPLDRSAYEGRVLLVAFWAIWCAPCVHEIPVLHRLEQEYAARGVTLVAANVDGPPDHAGKVERFVRDRGGNPDAVVWPDAATVDAWRAHRLPSLYIVGRDGRIVAGLSGEQSEATLRRHLEAALAASPGT